MIDKIRERLGTRNALILVAVVIILAIWICSTPSKESPPSDEEEKVAAQPVEVTRVVTQEITVEVTRIVEVPVTVTHTPGPSPTATITTTPTNTLTPTPSPTPFSTAGCVNLRSVSNFWNILKDDYDDHVYPTYDALDGKCVKFYGYEDLGIITTDYAWIGLMPYLNFDFVIDDDSPEGISGVKQYSTIRGILVSRGSGGYDILLRRVEPFDDLQQPIIDDGFYMVGDDFDISEGQWKSLWPPGTNDSCYWARTNPDTGDIRDNHFGQACIYVRIYTGDLFETSDCAPWVFIPP